MFVARHSHVDRNPVTQQAIATQRRKREQSKRETEQFKWRQTLKEREEAELRAKMERAEMQRREHIERYIAEREILRDMPRQISARIDRQLRNKHRLEYICKWICTVFGVSRMELRSERRTARLAHARQAFFYWSKQLTPCSFPQIGDFIGKDHTTVIHGARVYEENRHKKRATIRKTDPGKTIWWMT